MELAAETYRVKAEQDDSTGRTSRSKNRSSSRDDDTKSRKKSGKGKSKDKDKNKNKDKDKSRDKDNGSNTDRSFTSLTKSLGNNCCSCCVVLAQYIKEALKLICSCLNEKPTETKLCELFGQVVNHTWNLGTDACSLVTYIFRMLFFCDENNTGKEKHKNKK